MRAVLAVSWSYYCLSVFVDIVIYRLWLRRRDAPTVNDAQQEANHAANDGLRSAG